MARMAKMAKKKKNNGKKCSPFSSSWQKLRENVRHHGENGENSENQWRKLQFFSPFLPFRHGENREKKINDE